jgi:SAM-dependent methyltransferase
MSHEAVNRNTYELEKTVSLYTDGPIQLAELRILIRYKEAYWGKRLLDIGCGGGRTTEFLMHCTDDYLAIDYSKHMVECCRQRFPDARCLECDVRDMSRFDDASFDCVVFSNNGLDSLGHEDRLAALREINRVVVDGGLFVFSTHNRNYAHAITRPRLEFSWDPMQQAREIFRFFKHLRNHHRNRRFEQFNDDYWILNDRAHSYQLLTYYIEQTAQVEQLTQLGFEALGIYGSRGELLPLDGADRSSSWLYYVARKVGPPA